MGGRRPGRANLDDLVDACRSLAAALDAYADALADVRRELLGIAASIAASIAVGAALTALTAGVSAGAATATVTALTIQATALGATFAARAGTIARAVSLHATIGALEGIATYTVVEPRRIAAFHPNEDPFGSFELSEVALAAGPPGRCRRRFPRSLPSSSGGAGHRPSRATSSVMPLRSAQSMLTTTSGGPSSTSVAGR